jgi:hypothetical protein
MDAEIVPRPSPKPPSATDQSSGFIRVQFLFALENLLASPKSSRAKA